MTKKIFTGMVAVALIIMLCCTGLIMGVMYDYLGTQIFLDLKSQAQLVAAALERNPQDYLQHIKQMEISSTRVTMIDEDGSVLYDSHADEQTMVNHLEREEIQEALAEGEGKAVRESETLTSESRYYAIVLEDGNILRVSTSHYSQLGMILDTVGMVVVIAGVLFAMALTGSHLLTKLIVNPINKIDLNHPDVDASYEELEPLLKRIHQQNLKIRRQMEHLRRNQEEFHIIMENMAEGLLILDKDMEILTYNRAALRILYAGESPEDSREEPERGGDSLHRAFQNGNLPFRTAAEDALGGKKVQQRFTQTDQAYEIIGSPVLSGGKVTGAVLIIIDVTEQEVGERLRREFTSNVSHELKTPLTSIYGVSDMLASGIVRPEDVGQFAGTIKEESSRLISLIDDIIQLSRLDENSVSKEKEDVDVYLLAADVVRRLQRKAGESGVQVSLEGSSTTVKGIDYILDEIIYNLCENAIKYNRPQGGRVTVSVGMELGRCILRVSDTGMGIPKEDLDRVFERFYRVDKSHNRKIPGTGLGLSIVKHGVAYHGGTIALESVEGVGTTITVQLPVETAE